MTDSQNANTMAETLANDDVALGVLDNTYSPTLVELYGELGVDFVWIDFEHGGPSPWDASSIEDLLRAAENAGTELLVRVPTTEPAQVRKALDAGVRNLFLSQVETAEEVREALAAARFEYDGEAGRRGLASPRARRWGLVEDYVAGEDENVVVGVTIENESGLANLEEILEVPELGFVFAGPLDLSVALGHPGEVNHEDVQTAVEEIRETTLEAGVALGGLGFGMDDVNEKVEQGYQILNMGTTTGALQAAVEDWQEGYAGE